MEIYDDSPIDKAHFYHRRADKAAGKGLYDEACDLHAKAVCCLIEALKLSNNKFALESLQLQIKYHDKKQEVLRIKKEQRRVIEEAVRVQKQVMSRVNRTAKKSESDETLQKAIYRTFEEADSLLELLVHKKDTNDKPAVEPVPSCIATATKRPKDDSTVIEELRIVNFQLRSLITQLMSDLAASEAEVAALKKQLAGLETEGCRTTADVAPKNSQDCKQLAGD